MTSRVWAGSQPSGGQLPVGEPRWLDAEEQKAWRAALFSWMLLQDRLDRELTHTTGISHSYYEILVALSEAPGRMMRMSELADRCLSSRSRLSHAVTRLEERGWVRRQVCPDDGRGLLAVLTDEGFAALEAAPRCTSRACARTCWTSGPRSRWPRCATSARPCGAPSTRRWLEQTG